MLLRFALLVSILVSLTKVSATSVTVTMKLTFVPSNCVGGVQVLNGGFIRSEYKILETGSLYEWRALREHIPGGVRTTTEVVVTRNASIVGIQFRVSHTDHLGGTCYCWIVEEFVVTFNSSTFLVSFDTASVENFTDTYTCLTVNEYQDTFCNGNANEARGFVTEAFYFPGESGAECPGDSAYELISAMEPVFFEECDSASTRM